MLSAMIPSELDQRYALNFTLRPNCLLTRRPIWFLTPPRSLFFYKNPWGYVTHFLYEHGYAVDIFRLDFQNITHQKIKIQTHLLDLSHKHLFMDRVTYANLKPILQQIEGSTITVISSKNESTTEYYSILSKDSRFSLTYWLHQKWCRILNLNTPNNAEIMHFIDVATRDRLLDHCIRLAEIDFTCENN